MEKEYKYQHAIMVGRFQPFHKGHIRIIQKMVSEAKTCSIVVGSSQEHGTDRNPFRFRERKEMIKKWLQENDLTSQVKIIPQVDTNDYYGWVHTVIDNIKDFYDEAYTDVEAFYCGLEYDSQYYHPDIKNIEIVKRTSIDHPYISSTLIREMCMFQDERWRELVPEVSISFCEKLMRKYQMDGLAK